ncbi:threonine/serine exporter family protein [Mycobacterium sp. CVI_P3]|uniref:Threonine/serine exporter family protein n=1 Tax=Mycobacterium pinniadriaticum TaxID=2994102 RepID=A0ABT3SAE1_9MYCO|nr:threonine/serine exporter family protein [Mycobacterium pinniadriaticum]MCX2929869.1 threonine/serine exporter family protein [Mycobacterium pinniadriaticum]MCX2936482.1 threonine/serine exporter family protein [Mycobacterium pinniadriaticum]
MTQHPGQAPDSVSVDFLARLGAAMMAANYPIALIRRTLAAAADRYGLSNQLLLLPNFVQFGGSAHAAGTTVRVERSDADLRFDQTFPLATLVRDVQTGRITAPDGLAELARIHQLAPRFRPWVTVIGYMVQSTAFALIIQPTLPALLSAAGFGLMVGMLRLLARTSNAVQQLLPTIASFLVALIEFSLGRVWHFSQDSVRDILAPLAVFLPGAAITLAVIDLTTREVVSGSSRLTYGLMRLAQLAFGILIAAQVVGVTTAELNTLQFNTFGLWAPWAGVLLYACGILFYLGPPVRFLPWLMVTLLITYASQVAANALFGNYASGFGGGLALMLCALAISQRPNAPPAAALLQPGFWLLVPGSIGLIGVMQLINTSTSASITAMLVSMIAIALGLQSGLLLWRGRLPLAGRTDTS